MNNLKNGLSTNEYTLKNINEFIESQGLKKSRLAKKMGMSLTNLYDYLGNRRNGVLEFSRQLAETLGYDGAFFINPNFKSPYSEDSVRALAFSAGEQLSSEAQEGFINLLKVCDLFEIYNLED